MATDSDKADREERMAGYSAKLESAVEDLVTGEDWIRAIRFAANFRSRSFGNTLLIYVQHSQAYLEGRVPEPVPTLVAGFKQWRKLGRSVDRGQTGYAILAPVTRRFATTDPIDPKSWRRLDRGEKARPGEVVRSKVVGLKPAYVWDLSQTSGRPIPEQPAPQLLRGQAPEGLWDGLATQVEAAGFKLSRVPDAAAIGGVHGVTNVQNKTVKIRADCDDAAAVKTLAHELAHVLLHANPDGTSDVVHRGIAEVEAESVAMMIGASYGMDTSEYSVPYVSSWSNTVADAEPLQVVRATGERVRRTALAILDQLPDPPTGDGLPPGLDSPGSSTTTRSSETPASRISDPPASPSPTASSPTSRPPRADPFSGQTEAFA